jgi:hypothetical protein
MQYLIPVLFSLLALSSAATAAERLRFWNLTGFTIKELHLAPTGTTDWGFDQCKNDPDGAVDADERLTLKNVVPGHYDVKLVDKQGRTCVVRNVEVQAGNPTRSQFPKRTSPSVVNRHTGVSITGLQPGSNRSPHDPMVADLRLNLTTCGW